MFELHHGNCLDILRTMPDASVDAVVTDPPYGLSFMGKKWDYDVPSVEIWEQCLRVLRPGGYLLAFAGTRTQHRMAVRIEDAGFEIRDMIAWMYGSGFPKSHNLGKAIDKHGGVSVSWFGPWFRKWREENGITQKQVAKLFLSKSGGLTGCVANWELGLNMPTPEQFNLIRDAFGLPFDSITSAEREIIGRHRTDMGGLGGERLGQKGTDITAPSTMAAKKWDSWGTALKPAMEPITMARKPFKGTVADNVQAYGTGAINIDGCRIGNDLIKTMAKSQGEGFQYDYNGCEESTHIGRWPANVLHDGCEDVLRGMGEAARFFYTPKACKEDRDDGCEMMEARQYSHDGRTKPLENAYQRNESEARNFHPTVKPTDLMRYLCRMVTPPGGIVLDPFTGSGSTGRGAILEGFRFIGCEMDADYIKIAKARILAAEKAYQPCLIFD